MFMSTGKYFTYEVTWLVIQKNINIHIWPNSFNFLPLYLLKTAASNRSSIAQLDKALEMQNLVTF